MRAGVVGTNLVLEEPITDDKPVYPDLFRSLEPGVAVAVSVSILCLKFRFD